MFPKIYSKVLYGVIVFDVKWTCCLFIIGWLIGSYKPTQFEWSGFLKSMDACNVESLRYNSFIVWTNELCNCSYDCQLTIAFAFISSYYLRIYCFGAWSCVVTTTNTLTWTLSSLGFFATTVVIMFSLIQHILWIYAFLGQLRTWCLKLK